VIPCKVNSCVSPPICCNTQPSRGVFAQSLQQFAEAGGAERPEYVSHCLTFRPELFRCRRVTFLVLVSTIAGLFSSVGASSLPGSSTTFLFGLRSGHSPLDPFVMAEAPQQRRQRNRKPPRTCVAVWSWAYVSVRITGTRGNGRAESTWCQRVSQLLSAIFVQQ